MNCPYCDQPCRFDGAWAVCVPCDVDILVEDGETHIRFDRDMGEWTYALNLFLQSNKTVLVGVHKSYGKDPTHIFRGGKGYLEVEIDNLMQGVTPQNAYDKIKFLLVYY